MFEPYVIAEAGVLEAEREVFGTRAGGEYSLGEWLHDLVIRIPDP